MAALASCSLFPESTFTLAPESRLPRWVDLHGKQRSEVDIRVDFIVPLLSRAYAQVTVTDRRGSVIMIARAEEPGAGVQTAKGAPAHLDYPNYTVAAMSGTVDIFEQRAATNTLYMCDDPAVWAKLAPKASLPTSVYTKQGPALN
jgi:hypothetical protein